MSGTNQQPQAQLKLFVVYTHRDNKARCERVIVAPSKNEAIKEAQKEFPLCDVVDGAVASVEDVVRYILPTMMMTLVGIQQLLQIVAQNAAEQGAERALRKNIGLVRPQ